MQQSIILAGQTLMPASDGTYMFVGSAKKESQAARVLNALQLDAVVQLYIPRYRDEQIEELDSYIHDYVICRIPLYTKRRKQKAHISKRQFIYCRLDYAYSDEVNIVSYEECLRQVFQNKDGKLTAPWHARVYRRLQ